jgi:transcriptional regulator with XRE-family HTH domain
MHVVNGSAIVKLRNQKGMDQKTLAEKAGIHASVLSRLERNLQTDFHISVVVQIADVLEVTVDSLINRDYSPEQGEPHPDWQMIIQQMQNQPLKIQKQAAAIMQGYLSSLEELQE